MNKYIQLLHDQLTSQPMKFYDWNAESILEFLFCCYIEDHPLDNDAIRRCYEKIEPFFESLPRNASNELFQDIAAVCIAYEQAAFIEGVRVGVVLQEELTDLDKEAVGCDSALED